MARPRGKRRGRYRMTPARRAALRKAQAASARNVTGEISPVQLVAVLWVWVKRLLRFTPYGTCRIQG